MKRNRQKNKYTEDIVLNKILKDISEEKLDTHTSSSQEQIRNNYEDELIKHYRKKDILEKKQKYVRTAKYIFIFSFFIMLILVITYTIQPTQSEHIKIERSPKVKVREQTIITKKKLPKPIIIEPIKVKQKVIIPTPIQKTIIEPAKKPVKKEKTERELAKESLLREMQG